MYDADFELPDSLDFYFPLDFEETIHFAPNPNLTLHQELFDVQECWNGRKRWTRSPRFPDEPNEPNEDGTINLSEDLQDRYGNLILWLIVQSCWWWRFSTIKADDDLYCNIREYTRELEADLGEPPANWRWAGGNGGAGWNTHEAGQQKALVHHAFHTAVLNGYVKYNKRPENYSHRARKERKKAAPLPLKKKGT